MNRQVPRTATALYAIAATCAAIGALLWVRSRTAPRFSILLYGSSLDTDSYSHSAWRVWSPVVPEERLGLYLLAAALVLVTAARLVSIWRD